MRNTKDEKGEQTPPPDSGGPGERSGAFQGRPGPLVTIHKRRTLPGGKVEARPIFHCRKACPWFWAGGWNQCAWRNLNNPAYCDNREAQAEALAGLARELEGMARDMRADIIAERKRGTA